MDSRSAASFALRVNGERHEMSLTGATLLEVLRNDIGLNGPKYGCGLGECGACTVLIDGKAARACAIPAASVQSLDITTLEGLASAGQPHALQAAFAKYSATQCGYCLNGMVMTLAAYMRVNPFPSEAEVKEALRYNLCRCGSHLEVVDAALAAAGQDLQE